MNNYFFIFTFFLSLLSFSLVRDDELGEGGNFKTIYTLYSRSTSGATRVAGAQGAGFSKNTN